MRFLCLFLLPFASVAQTADDSLITIKGQVRDTLHAVGFYNMVVVNKSVGRGNFGNYDGTFEIRVGKNDLVGVSVVGYQTALLSFKDSAYRLVNEVVIYLEILTFTGKEVIVSPLKTLDELREERENIAKREVPTVSGVNAIQSPITALYMAFSKREQTKRLVAEMEYQDQQDNVVREILRLYVHNDIIDLPQDEFDEFITFLNLNTEFLKYASDYELITFIKDKFDHFQRIKEGY